MKRLLEHLERMERLHAKQWEIALPTRRQISPSKLRRLLPELLPLFTEGQLAQELRRRGYIVVKAVERNGDTDLS